MNERIRELAEWAGAEIHGHPDYSTICVNGQDADALMKKFAELIVRECTCFISDSLKAANVNLSSRPNDDYWLGFRHACEGHLTDIRQHFGVE